MLLLLGGFLILMLLGVPVAIAMAASSLLYILVSGVTPDVTLAQRMIAGIESFPLLAVPFFILAGNLMNIAGVTGRIYKFAVALVGWMRGGLGHVNIIGSVIFSGMSGTAIADAAGLGTIEIKAMKDHGYSTEFSVGVTAASATLGPIIPPSLPFVIYGMMANVSIGALFLGGVIPGVVMTLFMMATVAYFAHKNGWGSDSPFSWAQLGSAGLEIFIVLAFPMVVWLLVIGGVVGENGGGDRPRGIAGTRLVFRFLRRDGADGAGDPDRRHDARLVHADGSRCRRRDLVAVSGAGALSLDDAADGGESNLRHHRDHGLGAVHRDRGLDLRLAADGVSGGADADGCDARDHPQQMGVPAAGEHPDPVRRLLHRHHRRDHDPGADPAADRSETGHRSHSFRLDHDAQPDDRAPASTARHGTVRAGARGEIVGRAHDDGDPAVAGTATIGAGRHHLHPGADALAA